MPECINFKMGNKIYLPLAPQALFGTRQVGACVISWCVGTEQRDAGTPVDTLPEDSRCLRPGWIQSSCQRLKRPDPPSRSGRLRFIVPGCVEVQGDFIDSQALADGSRRRQNPSSAWTLQNGVGLGIFVAEIDNLGDAALNDGFGAFIAGEKGRVESLRPEETFPWEFKIALSSAWTTKGYLVSAPSRSQGYSSSEQPLGNPL